MNLLRRLSLAAGVALAPVAAIAAPSTFTFNAGPVIDVAFEDEFLPLEIRDFLIGESVIVSVTIDDTTPSQQTSPTELVYYDPLAMITLSGAESGAVVTLAPGAQIQLENRNEFDVSSQDPAGPPDEFLALSLFLLNDTDFRSADDFLDDPSSLAGSVDDINDLFASGIAGLPNLSLGSTAELFYVDTFEGAEEGEVIDLIEAEFFFAMEFGPVAAVPLPAGLPLLLGALGVFGLLARRRA